MLEELMKYLKVKKEIAEGVDLTSQYSDEDSRIELLHTLLEMQKKEPIFFHMTDGIYERMKDTLEGIYGSGNAKTQRLASKLFEQIERTKLANKNSPELHSSYFQWVTMVRVSPRTLELSLKEQLEHARQDYNNMCILTVETGDQPVCTPSLLSTMNFTMVISPKTYLEHPELLNRYRKMIKEGLDQHTDRNYQKRAKRVLRSVEKLQEPTTSKKHKTFIK